MVRLDALGWDELWRSRRLGTLLFAAQIYKLVMITIYLTLGRGAFPSIAISGCLVILWSGGGQQLRSSNQPIMPGVGLVLMPRFLYLFKFLPSCEKVLVCCLLNCLFEIWSLNLWVVKLRFLNNYTLNIGPLPNIRMWTPHNLPIKCARLNLGCWAMSWALIALVIRLLDVVLVLEECTFLHLSVLHWI